MENKTSIFAKYSFFYLILLVLFALFGLTSCSDDDSRSKTKEQTQSLSSTAPGSSDRQKPHSTAVPKTEYIKTSLDGWEQILERGVLRIIVPYSFQHNNILPRDSISYVNELKLITHFAESHNLTPVFISTKEFSSLIPSLQQGLGDIVVANLAITEDRKQAVNFTNPVSHAIEQLVVAHTFNKKISLEQLGALKIGVMPQTSFWETITAIKAKQTDIQIIELDDSITTEEKFNKVTSGEIDAVVSDSNRLVLFQEYRKDIKAIINLGKERPLAWAVRKNNPELLKKLNRYIKTEKLLQHLPDARLGDLDSIKKHRQLRLITRNNASTYFMWKNQLMGFEYELIKQFAKEQKLNLKVLVATDYNQMFEWLEQGYGDIIAAGLIKTPERANYAVEFTEPYLFVQEMIVQRNNEKAILSHKDLHGRTFYVRQSSSYWQTLTALEQQLKSDGIEFLIKTVPESMETEEIIKEVLSGNYDLTLADSHIIAIEKSWHSNLQASLALTGERGQRWLVRKGNKLLLNRLNQFIKKKYKGLFYNIINNKYFQNSRNLFDAEKRDSNNKSISTYDDLIKSLAQEYHFDWRLLAAQVNKESQFNPKAKSWAGAKGLLQVMPKTAREVGIKDLDKPENGLRAGVKYMAWINEQLSDELPADVQVWFTLAAYNAGLGHLKDARILAKQKGLNPNRWFGHVEKAFLLLSKPKYYKRARYGYVRGTEPVSYVKSIQALYELYSKKHPLEA